MPTIFVTGIDTDVGKTIATGLFARYLLSTRHTVMTQKLVQSGCQGMAEDILTHRRLMGLPLRPEDEVGLTCPYLFALPASPHLAARQEGVTIEAERILRATHCLEQQYEYVLLEGAGGLYVPLNSRLTILDYLAQQGYPVVLVSSAKLGSINHTLLTLEALHRRRLPVLGIIYNRHADANTLIAEDSWRVFVQYLQQFKYPAKLLSMPVIDEVDEIPTLDFSPFLEVL